MRFQKTEHEGKKAQRKDNQQLLRWDMAEPIAGKLSSVCL
jgi:hypothetical protein